VDEVVLFKGGVIFEQYISEKYEDCNMMGYTYSIRVHLGRDRQNATHTH
jgi:hypothetical protein